MPDSDPAIRAWPTGGIDMGLEWFAALSSGELIDNPRWFRKSEERLGILQKIRARCKRNSQQYRQLSSQITKRHFHTANQRADFQHKLSTKLVTRFGLMAVEELNIKGLSRSQVSKSMGDGGWGYFLQMLKYKAECAGTQLVKVNPNGSSQLCSNCGSVVQKVLPERQPVCPHCGFTANRDVNAAQNILALVQRVAVKCTVGCHSSSGIPADQLLLKLIL